MKKLFASSAVLVAAILTTQTASAEDICVGGPQDQWMTPDQVGELVGELGYDEFVLAFEDGCFEAKIVTEDQRRIEIYLDPITGEVMKTKEES